VTTRRAEELFGAILCASGLFTSLLAAGCGGKAATVRGGSDVDGGVASSAGEGGTTPSAPGAEAGSLADARGKAPGFDGGSAGGADGGCPIYQTRCGGSCMSTVADPGNCGGCGVTCSVGQVCSASACSNSCLPGMTPCNGACVDIENDDANCGGCSRTCGAGEGCAVGLCVKAAGSTTSPQCIGAGPPVVIGNTTAGCIAQTTFTWALCSCTDVNVSGLLLTDAFDSTHSPYQPGGLGGGIGLDGQLDLGGELEAWGALWASDSGGYTASGTVTVKQETHIGGPLANAGLATLDDDAYVDGNVTGEVAVKTTLHVPSSAQIAGPVTYGALVRQSVSVAPPCDCTTTGLLPISAWVAAAQPPGNDNASIGLDPDLFAQGTAQPARLDLPCGRYYLRGIEAADALTIAAHGNTALFIDGDVHAVGAISFVLDPTAQFDVVISGTVAHAGSLMVGCPNYPALSRTYIGSPAGLAFTGASQLGGNVYAAYGEVQFSGGLTVYGSVFAGDVEAVGGATIHYDRAVLGGELCPTPGGGSCQTCKDCGNQACIGGACGSCTSDDQCCAPLVCQSGQCVDVPSQPK
jgi:cytoskeletal protein CcmA (bactofilin family)